MQALFVHKTIFEWVKKRIDEGKKPFYLFSLFFKSFIGVKNFLYDRKFFTPKKADLPVISIGNIVAGGTGKTPFTIFLAKELLKRKKKVAVLSRGYLSKAEKKKKPTLACVGKGLVFPWEQMGDEPYLIAQKVPQVISVVGKNRYEGTIIAKKNGAQVVLLDDGMQHRKLFRDIEIVILNANDLFGKGHFIPRGYLRDFPKRIHKSDYLIINHVKDLEDFTRIKKELSLYKEIPTIAMKPSLGQVKSLDGKEALIIKDTPIGVFCGIADPKPFCRQLEKLGAKIVYKHFVFDHAKMQDRKLEIFAKKSEQKGAKFLICTEKDRVKLKKKLDINIPIGVLEISALIVDGKQYWEKLLSDIDNL